MVECMIVGAGGFIGAVCRYLIGLIPLEQGSVFPVKTFAINVLGSFVIGVIAALAAKDSWLDPQIVLFLKVGICGGFTTFSSFCIGSGGYVEKRQRSYSSFVCIPKYGNRCGCRICRSMGCKLYEIIKSEK